MFLLFFLPATFKSPDSHRLGKKEPSDVLNWTKNMYIVTVLMSFFWQAKATQTESYCHSASSSNTNDLVNVQKYCLKQNKQQKPPPPNYRFESDPNCLLLSDQPLDHHNLGSCVSINSPEVSLSFKAFLRFELVIFTEDDGLFDERLGV